MANKKDSENNVDEVMAEEELIEEVVEQTAEEKMANRFLGIRGEDLRVTNCRKAFIHEKANVRSAKKAPVLFDARLFEHGRSGKWVEVSLNGKVEDSGFIQAEFVERF